MRDTSGIYEVWAIFDAAFEKQVPTTPAKKAKSTAVEVKATGDKPWWDQFTPTKKKSGKGLLRIFDRHSIIFRIIKL